MFITALLTTTQLKIYYLENIFILKIYLEVASIRNFTLACFENPGLIIFVFSIFSSEVKNLEKEIPNLEKQCKSVDKELSGMLKEEEPLANKVSVVIKLRGEGDGVLFEDLRAVLCL